MNLSKEFKIGAIMLSALAVLTLGVNFLKGGDIFNRSNDFYGVYDHVSGLSVSNPVTMNGFKIGQVSEICLVPESRGQILVKFTITQSGFQFPKDTKARIESMDLLGSKTISLKLGQSLELAESGDYLDVEIEADLMSEVNKQIGPLKLKAESLLSTVDSVMVLTEQLLREDARPNLAKSFESIRRTLESIESTSDNLDGLLMTERGRLGNIFANLESITANFALNNEKLGNTISNFSDISDTLINANLSSVVMNAATAVENVAGIMEQINSGQGSLGLLLYNDSLYTNLNAAADNLDKLMISVKENPKDFVQFSLIERKDKSKKK